MGMAASQARYLALVARKSNCEYEGQQINQARTALSNQSANLFNQMLGLQVPVPPSTQDYTKTQYSYTDGLNDSTIGSWEQLAVPEEDYNYVVTHFYYTDVYTGSEKKMSDPQVQFNIGEAATLDEIEAAQVLLAETKEAYENAKKSVSDLREEAATLEKYVDTTTYNSITNSVYNDAAKSYTITNGTGAGATNSTFVNYTALADEGAKNTVKQAIQQLVDIGALNIDPENETDMNNLYYNSTDGTIAFSSDLRVLYNNSGNGSGTETACPVCHTQGQNSIATKTQNYDTAIKTAEGETVTALMAYNTAKAGFENLTRPTYIGNCELTLLTELDESQKAEIKQVVATMEEENINAKINDCFNPQGDYIGGVYEFKYNGVRYYTTYEDLYSSFLSGTGINNIDGQAKLSYYNASYVSTKIEETEKALIETDGAGRFTSIRFENDSMKYVLNMETVTDDAAYQDAMNQYYYENAKYDKTIQDINAKTSIIHQEDQQLELRLKQLDTEQKALSNEIDAVSSVVKDNVEKSFKTFGG